MKPMKIMIVGGCFDLLHPGHLDFLKKARAKCDYLIVLLEPDEKVKLLKGLERPVNNGNLRFEQIKKTRLANEIVELPVLKTGDEYYKQIKKVISYFNTKYKISNTKYYFGITRGDRNRIKNERINTLGKKLKIEVIEVNELLPEWSTTKMLSL